MATDEKIKNLSIYEQIDERFRKGGPSAVERYISDIPYPVSMSFTGTGDVEFTSDEETRSERYTTQSLTYDYGTGRISKGMRGLELLSRLCKGIPRSDLFLFNNVIYYSDPDTVKKADDEGLVSIVSANLGMDVTVQNVSKNDPVYIEYAKICVSIGKDVQVGVYRKENYSQNLLRVCRNLATTATRNLGRN